MIFVQDEKKSGLPNSARPTKSQRCWDFYFLDFYYFNSMVHTLAFFGQNPYIKELICIFAVSS